MVYTLLGIGMYKNVLYFDSLTNSCDLVLELTGIYLIDESTAIYSYVCECHRDEGLCMV